MQRKRWLCLALCGGAALFAADRPSTSPAPSHSQLVGQVRAADELARFYESTIANCDKLLAGRVPETAPRTQRIAYDTSLKALAQEPEESANDAALDQLNEYQLRHALATLQLHDMELYVELNARLDQLEAAGLAAPVDLSAKESLIVAIRAFRVQGGRQRSDLLERYLHPPPPPPTPESAMMGHLKAAAQRQDEVEAGGPETMTPDEAVATALAGRPMRSGAPAPSTIAPLDARTPNSFAIVRIYPWTFPMSSDVPGTLAFRADPAGNPEDATPSRENVMRLMSAAGLSPQMAEEVASGRLTIEEARRQGSAGGDVVSQATLLSASDPRWQMFYYGPTAGRNSWRSAGDDFVFSAGGGVYLRSDYRVNFDYDTRVNGEIDRRVNSSNDRRIDVQVDTRVNY